MKFDRVFAMPSAATFEIKPIAELLSRYLNGLESIIDPFARDSKLATYSNDLNPSVEAQANMDAIEYCDLLYEMGVQADAVLLDPPYSPRQISECYKIVGRKVGMKETQNAALYKTAKDTLDRLLKSGGIAITCGWNSSGFGLKRGYEVLEILLVNHGAAHNDTIVVVERKK